MDFSLETILEPVVLWPISHSFLIFAQPIAVHFVFIFLLFYFMYILFLFIFLYILFLK